MPSRLAWVCCSRLSKWWARCGSSAARAASDDDTLGLLLAISVVVGLALEDGRVLEVLLDGRRAGRPLVTAGIPGVTAGDAAAGQRVQQIDEDDHEPEQQ